MKQHHIIDVWWDGTQVQVKDELLSDKTHGVKDDYFTWRTTGDRLDVNFQVDEPFDSPPGPLKNPRPGLWRAGVPLKVVKGEPANYPYNVIVTVDGVEHELDPIVIIDGRSGAPLSPIVVAVSGVLIAAALFVCSGLFRRALK